jgi:translation initiation factor IF-2
MQRIKIEGKSVELTVSEQPVKRQPPDKKKAHENKEFLFDKRRNDEKDITSILRKNEKAPQKEKKDATPKHIVIPESLSVQELAMRMSRKASEVIKELMKLGVMATINQEVDSDTAAIVAGEMGITVEVRVEKSMAVIEEIADDSFCQCDRFRSRRDYTAYRCLSSRDQESKNHFLRYPRPRGLYCDESQRGTGNGCSRPCCRGG